MSIVIDNSLSQLGTRGAALWKILLPEIASELFRRQWQVLVLDRANGNPLHGVTSVNFPSYRISEGAADSILLQKICDWANADVLISSGLTTPLFTPTFQILLEETSDIAAAPGLLDHIEHRLALGFSSAVLCTSGSVSAKIKDVCGEFMCQLITSPASVEEPASIAAFARAVADQVTETQRKSFAASDQEFRAKWRKVREIQATVGFLGDP